MQSIRKIAPPDPGNAKAGPRTGPAQETLFAGNDDRIGNGADTTPRAVNDQESRAADDTGGFDWNDDYAPVVIQDQARIACYWNPRCQIVLRREADWPHEEEDAVMVINAESIGALIFDLSIKAMEACERGLTRKQLGSLIGRLQALEQQMQEAAA